MLGLGNLIPKATNPGSAHAAPPLSRAVLQTYNTFGKAYGEEAAHTRAHLYHVGMRAPWQSLACVQMKELVDLGGGQAVSDLQLLNDEHLAGQWPLFLLLARGPSYGCLFWVYFVLEAHLRVDEA